MNKIQIRAWTSDDGWFIGTDGRLVFIRKFNRYGVMAKLTYIYAKIFYDRVVVEVEEQK